MKAVVITLLSAAALAFAPAAAAAGTGPTAAAGTAPTHSCTPADPSFTSLAATPTVTCREARAMNHYMMTHETLSGGFTMRGKAWRGAVYSRADEQTYMVYRHGAQRIWITYGGAAS
jgi:hypothetical protein